MGFNSVSTLNFDSLSANCLDSSDSSEVKEVKVSVDDERSVLELRWESRVDLELERLDRGVP